MNTTEKQTKTQTEQAWNKHLLSIEFGLWADNQVNTKEELEKMLRAAFDAGTSVIMSEQEALDSYREGYKKARISEVPYDDVSEASVQWEFNIYWKNRSSGVPTMNKRVKMTELIMTSKDRTIERTPNLTQDERNFLGNRLKCDYGNCDMTFAYITIFNIRGCKWRYLTCEKHKTAMLY